MKRKESTAQTDARDDVEACISYNLRLRQKPWVREGLQGNWQS